MTFRLSRLVGLGLVLASVTPAVAQTAPQGPVRPTSVGLLGGFAAGAGDAGGGLGLNLAFEATDRVAVEGRGLSIMQPRSGQMGLEATGTMLFTIARGPKAAPYAAIGGGVYRASFDLGNQAMFGAMGSQFGPGTMMVPIQDTSGFGMMAGGAGFSGNVLTGWNGPTFNSSHMSAFYANRLGQMSVPANGQWGMRSFTDPALTLGGGIRLDVTERFYVRPDVRALVVFANGDRLTRATMTVGFGYRF